MALEQAQPQQPPVGGLNAMAQKPPAQAGKPVTPDADLTAANQIDTQPVGFDVNAEMEKYRQGQQVLDAQIQKMQDALQRRQQDNSFGLDPKWLAVAQQLATPTKTGSFFESLAPAAGAYQKAGQEQQAQQEQVLNQQAELQGKTNELHKQRLLENLSGNLYKKVPMSNGEFTYQIDPTVAENITKITGDPKYVAEMAAQQQKLKLDSAYQSLFVENPQKPGQYSVNTPAIKDIFRFGGKNEALEAVKAIPEMRRAGLLGDRATEGTPFDAFSLLATNPLMKTTAEEYAKRYKSGAIDEKDVDKYLSGLTTMATQNMTREENLDWKKQFQTMMFGLQQAQAAQSATNAAFNQTIAQQGIDLRREAAQDKKIAAANAAQGAIDSAQATIDQANAVANHPGRMSGLGTYDPRQLIRGTDPYNFNEEINKLKSETFLASVQGMKGLGALSNAEGQKVQSAIASLNTGMSKEAFDKQLSTITTIMQQAQQRAQNIISGKMPTGLPSNPTPAPAPGTAAKPATLFKVLGPEQKP